MTNTMTRAWEIYKETGCTTRYEFGICLQMSWEEIKEDKNMTVEKALEIANERAYSDYHINAGVERKAVAKVWEKNGMSRTYISIQCFTLNGRFKKSYDCGYIDNNNGEYVTTNRTEVDLAA